MSRHKPHIVFHVRRRVKRLTTKHRFNIGQTYTVIAATIYDDGDCYLHIEGHGGGWDPLNFEPITKPEPDP